MELPKRVSNPPNPFRSDVIEWLDVAPEISLEVYEEHAASIISHNDSPDIGFRHSINPYRGCFHGCAYCYARPTHNYLDWGAGTDFERKIVAKVNAAQRLREEFSKRSWVGETIVFSGVTDCYQPLEASYRLTRQCLEICSEYQNPVGIITKGALVRRDIDILQQLRERAAVHVHMSIAFASDTDSKLVEPYAPRPSVRFRAMSELHQAGIPVSVSVSPIIPGINDRQIPEILERARECGAQSAFMTLLRLPGAVQDVFFERMEAVFPDRIGKIKNQLKDMKNGVLNRSDFGTRMYGEGPRWEAISWLFKQTCDRLGIKRRERGGEFHSTFKRPSRQMSMQF